MSIQRYEALSLGGRGEMAQVPEAEVLVDVQTQLRGLDAKLAVDLGRLELFSRPM